MTRATYSRRNAEFRARLVQARLAAHLTQAAVAKRLGRPQSFLSKVEHGERRLDVVEFVAVCRALDVDPLEFLRDFLRTTS